VPQMQLARTHLEHTCARAMKATKATVSTLALTSTSATTILVRLLLRVKTLPDHSNALAPADSLATVLVSTDVLVRAIGCDFFRTKRTYLLILQMLTSV
jgi:hypothetical protein